MTSGHVVWPNRPIFKENRETETAPDQNSGPTVMGRNQGGFLISMPVLGRRRWPDLGAGPSLCMTPTTGRSPLGQPSCLQDSCTEAL